MSLNPVEYPGMEVALNEMNDAMAGSGKPLLCMGGGMIYADGGDRQISEDGAVDVTNPIAGHALHLEQVALKGAERGVRSLAIRSSLVYGRGAGMFVRGPIEAARQYGAARYVGTGAMKMSTVHIDDLIDLLARALRDGPAGTVFNAAGGAPVTTLELAQATADAAGTGKVEIGPDRQGLRGAGLPRRHHGQEPVAVGRPGARPAWLVTEPAVGPGRPSDGVVRRRLRSAAARSRSRPSRIRSSPNANSMSSSQPPRPPSWLTAMASSVMCG